MGEQVTVRKGEESNAVRAALEQTKGGFQQFRQYVTDVNVETKRVTWPSKQEIYGTTVMVILTTFIFGIYFWMCDEVFRVGVSRALRYLLHKG